MKVYDFNMDVSQSLWVRDRFLIDSDAFPPRLLQSQSLWVRDRFLIVSLKDASIAAIVAIPLGQGQVFNSSSGRPLWLSCVAIPLGQGQVFNLPQGIRKPGHQVAIPLGQGQVFNSPKLDGVRALIVSQSLWVRDRFLIAQANKLRAQVGRNPFGSGTGF